MASQAQITANRLNAQLSTGPRTPAGKTVAARNSLKHGLTARQQVIKGESPADYELRRAVGADGQALLPLAAVQGAGHA